MPDLFQGWPFWVVFVVFFFGAMARGQAIYWLARYLTGVGLRHAPPRGWRARTAAWLESPSLDSGAALLRRFGLVAVPLCYLTVGLQSAVLAAAGVVRLNAWAFLLAQVPGSLAWATIYTTIGWALWEATLFALAGSPWGIAALLTLTVLIVTLVVRHRRRRA